MQSPLRQRRTKFLLAHRRRRSRPNKVRRAGGIPFDFGSHSVCRRKGESVSLYPKCRSVCSLLRIRRFSFGHRRGDAFKNADPYLPFAAAEQQIPPECGKIADSDEEYYTVLRDFLNAAKKRSIQSVENGLYKQVDAKGGESLCIRHKNVK